MSMTSGTGVGLKCVWSAGFQGGLKPHKPPPPLLPLASYATAANKVMGDMRSCKDPMENIAAKGKTTNTSKRTFEIATLYALRDTRIHWQVLEEGLKPTLTSWRESFL